MSDGPEESEFYERTDALFQALPARSSPEYLEQLRDAPLEELPPQVLVRAYREAAAEGWEEARKATFERLVRQRDGRYDHLGPLIQHIRNRVPPNQSWQDVDDLLQDTFVEMLRVLPTPRGEQGQKSWHLFARRCAQAAWRKKDRQGRRGQRVEPPRQEPVRTSDGWTDPMASVTARTSPSEVDVWALLESIISGITDPLIRAVGEDLWLSGDPSPVTGKGASAGGKAPLDVRLNVSRDRVVRAERSVLARILAELEQHGIPRERLDEYRMKPR